MQPYERKLKQPKEEDYGQAAEEFFDESNEVAGHKKEQFQEVNKICEKGREQLKIERSRNISKLQENVEEKSSSQFVPSGFNQESSSPASKIDSQVAKNLMNLIRECESDLRDPRLKGQKIKELALLTRLSHEIIRKKVYDFLRRRKESSKNNTPQQRLQHQTIYRKTEMFDDAIKRVLKVTPYACINDLKQEIYKKLNLDLAKETLIRRLKNLNYTYTKFSLQKKSHGNQDNRLKQIRRKYLKNYREILSKGFPVYFYGTCHIAVDECRGSMWMKSKDNGALDHILYEKDVVNVCLILSKERIEYYKIFIGFYRKENYATTFYQWAQHRDEVKNASERRSQHKSYCYLFSEVSPFHNEPNLHEETIITNGLLQLGIVQISFPPYSYSMNPAEVLFNQLKYLVKSRVKQFQNPEFLNAIDYVINHNLDIEDIKFAYSKVAEEYLNCC